MRQFIELLRRLNVRGIHPKVFIDVGAHFGETISAIRSVFPESRVISFEANPNCAPALQQLGSEFLIALLGKETTSETTPFYMDSDCSQATGTGCSIYKEKSHYFENAKILELPTYALDDIIKSDMQVDFLKIDVQGAELDVLEGAKRVLTSTRFVFLEVSLVQCNEGAPLLADVFEYMTARGFSLRDIVESTYIDNVLLQTNLLFENNLWKTTILKI